MCHVSAMLRIFGRTEAIKFMQTHLHDHSGPNQRFNTARVACSTRKELRSLLTC